MSHTGDMRQARKTAESGHKRTPQKQHRPREEEVPARQRPKTDGKEGAVGPGQRLGSRTQRVWKGREEPTSPNLPGAAFPDSSVMLEWSF